ncbi:hypothetical protein C4D60_Mb01t01050 [Musa balbisiana]|uniref:Uncharacterized protein n=1 Tax=Musa balbisiana TaxID=52838 RepID=A0A4S8JIZ1_MUSBA|nr:hypothetical protein C4D60_Mb01t01050 [Musa balbisiana]
MNGAAIAGRGEEKVFTPTWSKSLIVLVTFGIVPSPPSTLSPTPLSSKCTTPRIAYFVEILTFGYLDEKLIDTNLMKFLGLYPSALSRYLEFASAFSTSLAPFTAKRSLSMRAKD